MSIGVAPQVDRHHAGRLGRVDQEQGRRSARTIAAIAAIGCTVPSTFEAWVIATSVVRGVIAFLIASGSTYPLSEATRDSVITPAFSSATKGLLTELCSRSVVITWSPGWSTPLIARFRASVQLSVKIQRSGAAP